MLLVDENRADVPATVANPVIDYDADNFDENMLLNLEGIGIFGDDFSKKIQDEITEGPKRHHHQPQREQNNHAGDEVKQRFFESGMRANPNDPTFQRNFQLRRRFRPRLHMR